MDAILQQIADWLKGMLVDGIMNNLSGMFDAVNRQVADVATQVGSTPASFSPGVFNLVRGISESVIIPIAVTGVFHIDGFLDTADALASYRSAEKKLEILKDPHIGSFAVISCCVCILLMLGGIGVIIDDAAAPVLLSAVYMISRAFAALTSVYFDKAKPDGMLAAETAKADGTMIVILVTELLFGAVLALLARASYVPVLAVAYTLFIFVYKKTVMKNFGGVTGDTAGYFVVASEVTAVCAVAVFYTVMKSL